MLDKQELFDRLNEGVLDERFGAFERNLQKNLPYIRQYGGLRRILGNFDGKHVIIIAAGPSLEENLPLLKKYQFREEVLLVAADMALKVLVSHGIRPQYVFSCETSPVDFFGGVDSSSMHLIAFSCMSNINIRRWKGDVSFYNWMLRGAGYESLWERAGIDLGFLATGNIITTQAVSFALGCGIKSLVLAGNDLGFSRRYYAPGSAGYREKLLSSDRLSTADTGEMGRIRGARAYEIDRGGARYYTSRQFLAAKMWLEELFAQTDITVYDSSLPGCSEKYVSKIQLKDFFILFEKRKKKRRG